MTYADLIEDERRCRFALGDPRCDDRWCGADTGGNGAWCPAHRARVFLPAGWMPARLRFDHEKPKTARDEVRATWLRAMGVPRDRA
jgi:hypothetical protein